MKQNKQGGLSAEGAPCLFYMRDGRHGTPAPSDNGAIFDIPYTAVDGVDFGFASIFPPFSISRDRIMVSDRQDILAEISCIPH